jgi:flagellar biosynthetic protein FliR
MRVDVSFLPVAAAAFLLIFARIGTMVMVAPGIGEASVPVRIRLVAALALTAMLFPLHRTAFQIDLRTKAVAEVIGYVMRLRNAVRR